MGKRKELQSCHFGYGICNLSVSGVISLIIKLIYNLKTARQGIGYLLCLLCF